jgi:hypothetical protein
MIPFLETTTTTTATSIHTSIAPAFNPCPTQFLWACNTIDLFTEVGLAIVLIALIVMFGIYLALRGPFGKMFYHADKLRISLVIDAEGSVDAVNSERFGSIERIKSGKDKDLMIIPRPNSTFKAPGTPLMSVVLGRGKGISTNPYLADYIERMGGAWPVWSGAPPPAKPQDLNAFYLMYANWKAQGEDKEKTQSREQYVAEEFAKLKPPNWLTPSENWKPPQEEIDAWAKEMKEKIARVYQATEGKFNAIALQLQDPETDLELKNGIYEVLNGMIQSEPVELWPTWIVGKKVAAQDIARWTMPISGAEVTSLMAKIEVALKRDERNTLMKVAVIVLLFFGIAISFAIVYSVLVK